MKFMLIAFTLALIASVQCYRYPAFEPIEEITVNPFRSMSGDMTELLRQKRSFPGYFGGGIPDYGGYGSPFFSGGGGAAGASSSASAIASSNAVGGGRGGYDYPYQYFRY